MKIITMIFFVAILLYGCTGTVNKSEDSGSILINTPHISVEAQKDAGIDVSAHDSLDDCYSVIDGRVYDITDFIENSPEYRSSIDMDPNRFRSRLAMVCGTDGTIIFEELYGENHMRLDSYFLEEM